MSIERAGDGHAFHAQSRSRELLRDSAQRQLSTGAVRDPVDTAARVIGDVKGAVGRLGEAAGPVRSAAALTSAGVCGKAIGENLILAGGPPVREGNKSHVEAGLGFRSSVP